MLLSRRGGFFRLAKAEVLEAEGRSHQAEGEAWVPKEKILWFQVMS